MPKAIGIDFGTSKTVASYVVEATGRADPVMLNASGTDCIVPTSVLLDGSTLLIGEDAEDNMSVNPSRYRAGRDFKLSLGDRSPLLGDLSAEDLTARFLRDIREKCCQPGFIDEIPVTDAVVTYPVSFALHPARLEALESAAKAAGFSRVRLVCEPEAAGRAYLEEANGKAGNVLVVDWGGGTLDVSILSIRDDGTIACNDRYFAGSDKVGGESIDARFLSHLLERVRTELRVAVSVPLAEMPARLRQIQRDKIKLDKREEVVCFPGTGTAGIRVSRAELERLVEPLVEEAVETIRTVLDKAASDGLSPDTMLLVGGTVRMPFIQKRLQAAFGLKAVVWQRSRLAVALGAAYCTRGAVKRWTPGEKHPKNPHVVAGETPDSWTPERGYRWDPENGTLSVRWVSGTRVEDHVFTGNREGVFVPESGWRFKNPSDPFAGVSKDEIKPSENNDSRRPLAGMPIRELSKKSFDGLPDAKFELAIRYLKGEKGCSKNEDMGRYLLHQAVALQLPEAQYFLACALRNGRFGFPTDPYEAARHAHDAMSAGHIGAKRMWDEMHSVFFKKREEQQAALAVVKEVFGGISGFELSVGDAIPVSLRKAAAVHMNVSAGAQSILACWNAALITDGQYGFALTKEGIHIAAKRLAPTFVPWTELNEVKPYYDPGFIMDSIGFSFNGHSCWKSISNGSDRFSYSDELVNAIKRLATRFGNRHFS